MRTEKELDYLEKFILELARSATQKAYFDALSSGHSVTEIVDGKLVITAPDGTSVVIHPVGALSRDSLARPTFSII
ncbi:MAG: hypothetical protein JXR91_06765 [Deltaproteobacteria bacterium]|nr:hypothetical protein [Deltaproteobacteria bacterium]